MNSSPAFGLQRAESQVLQVDSPTKENQAIQLEESISDTHLGGG